MHTRRLLLAVSGLITLLSFIIPVTAVAAVPVVLLSAAVIVDGANALGVTAVAVCMAYATASAVIGQILLRFSFRAFPLLTSGRRQRSVIVALAIVVSFIAVAGTAVLVLLLTEVVAPIDPRVAGGPAKGVLEAIAKGVVAGMSAFFLAMAKVLILYLATLTAGLMLAVGVPLLMLFRAHLKPKSLMTSPYVLFLRPFRGTSNGAALGPLARGLPAGIRIVLLSPPFSQVNSWDPVSLGFVGFCLTRPFSSTPIRLLSDDDTWLDDVRELATRAKATVIDISDPTTSMQKEIDVVNELSTEYPVVWLARDNVALDPQVTVPPLGGHALVLQPSPIARVLVRYTETRWPGIIRRLFVAAGVFIPLDVVGLVLFEAVTGKSPTEDSVVLTSITLTALSIATLTAKITSWPKGYSRKSAAEVRAALNRILTGDSTPGFMPAHAREIWRWPATIFVALAIAGGVWLWRGVSNEMATLRDSTKATELQAARDRLAQIPLLRATGDRLLAARWAARAGAERRPDARLAFQLKSLATSASASGVGTIDTVHMSAHALAMTYRQGRVATGAFTPDGERVFVAGDRTRLSSASWAAEDGEVDGQPTARLWNTLPGIPATREYALPDTFMLRRSDPQGAALSPDSTFAALTGRDLLRLVYFGDEAVLDIASADAGLVTISSDSSRVAVGMAIARVYGSAPLRVFTRSGKWISDSREDVPPIKVLRFNPSGRALLAANERSVTLWNPETGTRLARWAAANGTRIVDAIFLPSGDVLLATDAEDGDGEVLTLDGKNLVQRERPFVAPAGVSAIAVSRDGSLLAVGSRVCCTRSAEPTEQPVRLVIWHLASRRQICEVGHPLYAPISSLAFDFRSRRLALVDERGLRLSADPAVPVAGETPLCVYTAGQAKELAETVVGFSPDGRHLLTLGDAARLWRVDALMVRPTLSTAQQTPSLDRWLVRAALRFDEEFQLVPRFDP